MQTLFLNFANSIFPISLVVLFGYLLRRWKKIDPQQVAHIVFYIMLPALIFRDLYAFNVPLEDSFKMIGITITLIFFLLVIGWIIGRFSRVSSSERAAVILITAFMNCGALGLSVSEFGFGIEAVVWAEIFFIAAVVMLIVVGVFIGESGRLPLGKAVTQVLKAPIIYALGAALLARTIQVEIPAAIMRPIDLAASGAIPLTLVVLGIQFAESSIPKNWRLVSLPIGIRLIISPLIAFGLAHLLNLEGLPLKVAVLQAGMPIAVLIGVIATQYDLEPEFVASTILVSTLVSPITLAIILSLMNSV